MSTGNGTALAVLPTAAPATNATTQLEPSTPDQAFWLATQLVKSGLLGRSVTKPEAAFAVILAGRELGLTAMQSLRSIHIIEGKPTLSSDLMAALVLRSPTCKYFQMIESTSTVATYETHRVGTAKPTVMSFTMEDAKQAGVTGKQNWKTYPAAMLRARCIAAIARVVYPDLLMGIYEQDEISAPSTMQATREAVPLHETLPNPVEDDEEPQLVKDWKEKFSAATTLDELKALAEQSKQELDDDTRAVLSVAFIARQKEIKAAQ